MGRYPKCPGCGQMIEPYEKEFFLVAQHNNKWWHNVCWENKDVLKANKQAKQKLPSAFDPPDTNKLIHDYIKTLDPVQYNPIKLNKQLKNLKEQGFEEEKILSTLKYWYGVKKHSGEESNGGVGIVPYVYGDAMKYYKKQELHRRMDEYFSKCEKGEIENKHIIPESRPQQTKGKRVRPINTRWIDMK